MGKNLKGQEIGKGISQRPDKTYRARYVNSLGKRVEENFTNLKDAQAWLAAERAVKTCLSKSNSPNMKVDELFKVWIKVHGHDLSPNTVRNYTDRYERNIKPYIGRKKLVDVKPQDCKHILNEMEMIMRLQLFAKHLLLWVQCSNTLKTTGTLTNTRWMELDLINPFVPKMIIGILHAKNKRDF